MKDFINIFVSIILIGFAVGITIVQTNNDGPWFFLFFPLIIMMFIWGRKLYNEY